MHYRIIGGASIAVVALLGIANTLAGSNSDGGHDPRGPDVVYRFTATTAPEISSIELGIFKPGGAVFGQMSMANVTTKAQDANRRIIIANDCQSLADADTQYGWGDLTEKYALLSEAVLNIGNVAAVVQAGDLYDLRTTAESPHGDQGAVVRAAVQPWLDAGITWIFCAGNHEYHNNGNSTIRELPYMSAPTRLPMSLIQGRPWFDANMSEGVFLDDEYVFSAFVDIGAPEPELFLSLPWYAEHSMLEWAIARAAKYPKSRVWIVDHAVLSEDTELYKPAPPTLFALDPNHETITILDRVEQYYERIPNLAFIISGHFTPSFQPIMLPNFATHRTFFNDAGKPYHCIFISGQFWHDNGGEGLAHIVECDLAKNQVHVSTVELATGLNVDGPGNNYVYSLPLPDVHPKIPHPLLGGLVNYWQYDESAGSIIDLVGDLGSAVQVGEVVESGNGPTGEPALYTANGYFRVEDPHGVHGGSDQSGDDSFSLDFWMKPEVSDFAGQTLATVGWGDSGEWEWRVSVDADQRVHLRFSLSGVNTTNQLISTVPVSENQWYHIAISYDSALSRRMTLSVNREPIIIAYLTWPGPDGTYNGLYEGVGDLVYGAMDNGSMAWDGLIVPGGHWEYVLTPAMWDLRYNNGQGLGLIDGVFVTYCAADCAGSGDGHVDIEDLLAVLSQWGVPGGSCAINGNVNVGVQELLQVLSQWGPCTTD